MKKNVLMVVYAFYPFDSRVRLRAETLEKDGRFKVTVLALKQDSVPREYDLAGVFVKELDSSKYRGKNGTAYIWSYLRFLWRAFLAVSGLFFRRQIDIVHVHNMPNFLIFSAILPRLFGKRLVLDIHDTVPETFAAKFSKMGRFFSKFFLMEERISCALAHRIISVNHVQKATLVDRGIKERKIHISMNVPDQTIFNSQRQNSSVVSDEKFKMVYHGTITERLGIDLVINAVSVLLEKIPNLEFHLWGTGEFLDDYMALSERLGLASRVFFNEPVLPNALPEILKEMDLGVVANRKSSATDLMLPVKMMEYIALGIPVIAPRLKGIEYYFSDDMVTYFEPDNIDSLADAIFRLYQDKERRTSQETKAMEFLDRYGWEKQKKDFLQFYKEL